MISLGARFMVLSALSFSLMSLLVKLAGQRLPSQELVLARALVSLVLSWLIVRRIGVPPLGNRRRLLLLRGLVGFGGLSCFYYAVTRLPLAEATVLHYTNPVFTALFAALFLGERTGKRLLISLPLCLAGVLLVTRPAVLFSDQAAGLDLLAVCVALAGALFSSLAYVLVRRLSKTENAHVIVLYFSMVAVPLSIPPCVGVALMPTPPEWLLLLGIGVTTQLGQIYLTKGLRHETAARATTVAYLQIVFAALWSALVFGVVPDALSALGATLIVSGTLLVAWKR